MIQVVDFPVVDVQVEDVPKNKIFPKSRCSQK